MNPIPFQAQDLQPLPLQAHQIVYHSQPQGRFYGEVIQVVPERDRCWIRPLAYVVTGAASSWVDSPPAEAVQDLRWGPDLICPLGAFYPALDQDWLAIAPLLSPVEPWQGSDYGKGDRAIVQARLREIFREITGSFSP